MPVDPPVITYALLNQLPCCIYCVTFLLGHDASGQIAARKMHDLCGVVPLQVCTVGAEARHDWRLFFHVTEIIES